MVYIWSDKWALAAFRALAFQKVWLPLRSVIKAGEITEGVWRNFVLPTGSMKKSFLTTAQLFEESFQGFTAASPQPALMQVSTQETLCDVFE